MHQDLDTVAADFERDGACVVRGVLEDDEVVHLASIGRHCDRACRALRELRGARTEPVIVSTSRELTHLFRALRAPAAARALP